MKPLWTDSPSWAEWLAQESDGEWRWYSRKPFLFDAETAARFISNGHDDFYCRVGWRNDSFGEFCRSNQWSPPINFEKSLEERPK